MLRLYVCFHYTFICYSVYTKRSRGCRIEPFMIGVLHGVRLYIIPFIYYSVDMLFRVHIIPYTTGEVRRGAGLNRL